MLAGISGSRSLLFKILIPFLISQLKSPFISAKGKQQALEPLLPIQDHLEVLGCYRLTYAFRRRVVGVINYFPEWPVRYDA